MASQRIGYIRVSSLDQSADELDGISLNKVFTDKASAKDTNNAYKQSIGHFLTLLFLNRTEHELSHTVEHS